METAGPNERRHAFLSTMHPAWRAVAELHATTEKSASTLYELPIEEFRQVPYRPPPLAADAPVPGRDIRISRREVSVRDGAVIGLRLYEPMTEGKSRTVFFNVHGGGWTVGTTETEENQNRLVCFKNNIVVISVDYRRAPEFPFPYPLNDAYDAFKWLIKNAEELGVSPHRILIGGGSAGANIASQSAVIAQMARDEGISGIIGQVLNIPVTCHPDFFPAAKYEYFSYEQNADAPIVSAARMRWFWNNYLPTPEANPKSSPLLSGDLSNLPPACKSQYENFPPHRLLKPDTRMNNSPVVVQIAGMDPLRDEGIAYAEALRANGVPVRLKTYPGMPHAFYVYPNLQPSMEYTDAVVEWMAAIEADHLLKA
ncbi:unnamed protein product [Clonostachys rosea]|uniref:Alpha/beta hydrolase fold-3 domain-containing protein n=1 Tax=Bionectria ochroleuca TaxID=29856 RepID=A0ABY6TYT5_BIOOC|nr:unnamed protein product [Clonostachys rosea]